MFGHWLATKSSLNAGAQDLVAGECLDFSVHMPEPPFRPFCGVLDFKSDASIQQVGPAPCPIAVAVAAAAASAVSTATNAFIKVTVV